MVKRCFDHGINFFDTAEAYGGGEAERQMGNALLALGVPREHYVLTTKLYWCKIGGENRRGLSRKHVLEGMKNSLKRLQHEYVDVVFCHRQDSDTPLLETCRAMNYLIEEGYAFYWGTSMWHPDTIYKAI